jgi:hypothetical protein
VPTITLEGDANGARHPSPASDADNVTGRYTHRLIGSGVGQNVPQGSGEPVRRKSASARRSRPAAPTAAERSRNCPRSQDFDGTSEIDPDCIRYPLGTDKLHSHS